VVVAGAEAEAETVELIGNAGLGISKWDIVEQSTVEHYTGR
jgi:hypothetical protein